MINLNWLYHQDSKTKLKTSFQVAIKGRLKTFQTTFCLSVALCVET